MFKSSRFFSSKDILFFLLCVSATINYRIETGIVSFALVELVVLLVTTLLWANRIVKKGRPVFFKDPLGYVFVAITFWALVIRPLNEDWMHGLSDVRDWVIPTLLIVTLVSNIRSEWRRFVKIFLLVAIALMGLGLIQVGVDGFRPFLDPAAEYKRGFFQSLETSIRPSFAVGFFGHPGVYAEYLFCGCMILVTVRWQKKWKWLHFFLICGFIGAILYSYSKVVLISLPTALLGIRFLTNHRRRFWLLFFVPLIIGGFITLGLYFLIQTLGLTLETSTFAWRIEQWRLGFSLLGVNPIIILLGNGVDKGISQGFLYGNPHNFYLFALLQYGVIGLILVLLMCIVIFRQGLRAYKRGWMQREPLLAGLWIALLGLLFFGLFGTSLSYVDYRTMFALLASLFTGLWYEKRREFYYE